jgi:hypothetical protein
MTINEGRQKRPIAKAGSGKESRPRTVLKSEAYSRATIRLPTVLLIAIRQMLKDSDEEFPDNQQPWTLSLLLERWLFSGLRKIDFAEVAVKAPGFKRAALAWMRWAAQERAHRPRVTRLEAFLKANNLKPSKVAREAKVSRQHLVRLRKGMMQPTIPMATRIRYACGRMTHRRLKLSDLFEV